MKYLLIAAALLSSAAYAETIQLPITNVNPVFAERWVTKQVTTTVKRCMSRQDAQARGWIQKGTNKVFGSTQGLIGALIGGAIGNQIGGGSSKKIATGLGVLFGNQVGNNMATTNNSHGQVCRDVEERSNVRTRESVISHYEITVDVNGQSVILNRNATKEYKVGESLYISIQ